MDRDARLARYEAALDEVRAALDAIGPEGLDRRPADGGWTAREVVHHPADAEARSMLRLRQLLAEDDPLLEAYDQDRWAARLPYDGPVDLPLAVVAAVRALSAATLRTLDQAAWSRAGRHPEHDEPYSVERWLAIYSEHPHEHAAQIRTAGGA